MEENVYSNWRALIRPRRVERDSKSTQTYGKFVIRPLERGFGTTIGNGLRRILLSSLQGAAITSVRIEGVLHEFSFIPGIVEDVTDIILNIKGVLLRTSSMEPVKGHIKAVGRPGETVVVKASDFTFDAVCRLVYPSDYMLVQEMGKNTPSQVEAPAPRKVRASSIVGGGRKSQTKRHGAIELIRVA